MNKKVIIRTEKAGVFYGELFSREGNEVMLVNARRLWRWEGAFTLSEMSVYGVSQPKNCKFTISVPEITLLGIIEIIPCSETAIKSIESVQPYKC